jgi:Protein of unknown function (DUF2905)
VATDGKVLLFAGLALGIAGVVFLLLARLGVTRLPGDVVVRRGNFTLYAPIGLIILLSVVLTIMLNVLARR